MPHPTYSVLTTCWHGHLLSTSLQGGISKLPAVQNISPVARCLCAYCYTFFLLPIAGGWTPLINKLLSCFDTKSFRKWTLIKPLQEKNSNECWGCRSASNHSLFPSPLDFCFHASSTRAHEVTLTKHFSVTGQQSCHLKTISVPRLEESVHTTIALSAGVRCCKLHHWHDSFLYTVTQWIYRNNFCEKINNLLSRMQNHILLYHFLKINILKHIVLSGIIYAHGMTLLLLHRASEQALALEGLCHGFLCLCWSPKEYEPLYFSLGHRDKTNEATNNLHATPASQFIEDMQATARRAVEFCCDFMMVAWFPWPILKVEKMVP